MRGKAFNGGAERQYSVGWAAVLIRNIGGVERAQDSDNEYLLIWALLNIAKLRRRYRAWAPGPTWAPVPFCYLRSALRHGLMLASRMPTQRSVKVSAWLGKA